MTGPPRARGMMPRMSFVLLDRPRPHVALITLNRPERMNSMAFHVMVPFREMLGAISVDNDVRVVVVTSGTGFLLGRRPDRRRRRRPEHRWAHAAHHRPPRHGAPRRHHPDTAEDAPAGDRGDQRCGHRRRPVPVAAFDIRIASSSAYFRAAGINNGLTASELGLSYLLPRDRCRAFEIMLTGRDVDAAEAERIGLVSRTVPPDELLAACYDVAERIIGWSRPGVELTKRTLWSSLGASSLSQHMNQEGIGQLFVRMLTDNFEEAARARSSARRLPGHAMTTTPVPIELPQLSTGLSSFSTEDPGTWQPLFDRFARPTPPASTGSWCRTTWCSASTSRPTAGPSWAGPRGASSRPAPTATGWSRSPPCRCWLG